MKYVSRFYCLKHKPNAKNTEKQAHSPFFHFPRGFTAFRQVLFVYRSNNTRLGQLLFVDEVLPYYRGTYLPLEFVLLLPTTYQRDRRRVTRTTWGLYISCTVSQSSSKGDSLGFSFSFCDFLTPSYLLLLSQLNRIPFHSIMRIFTAAQNPHHPQPGTTTDCIND